MKKLLIFLVCLLILPLASALIENPILYDDFTDNSIDNTLWTNTSDQGGGTVTIREQNQNMEIDITNGGGGISKATLTTAGLFIGNYSNYLNWSADVWSETCTSSGVPEIKLNGVDLGLQSDYVAGSWEVIRLNSTTHSVFKNGNFIKNISADLSGELSFFTECGVGTVNHDIDDLYMNRPELNIDLINPVDDSAIVGSSQIFNATAYSYNITKTNATLNLWYSNGTIFNQTTNTLTGILENKTSYSISNLDTSQYIWNVEICGTNQTSDTVCVFADKNKTFSRGYIYNSENFAASLPDIANASYTLNITLGSGITALSGNLIYNGTSYSADFSTVADDIIFTRDLTTPSVDAVTVFDFNWTFQLSDGSVVQSFNTPSQQQTISPSLFDRCTASLPDAAVNYSVYDEATNNPLNTTLSATFLYNTGGDVNKNTSFSGTNSSYEFCIRPNATFYVDAEMFIELDGYANRKYSLNFEEYSNDTKEVALYLLNESDATNVIIQVKDQGFGVLEGYTVRVYRDQPSTGRSVLVEEDITNVFGQVVVNLVENNVDYDFLFLNESGSIVKSINNSNVICGATPCIIPVIIEEDLSPFEGTDTCSDIEDLDCSVLFNEDTNITTFSWSDTSGSSPSFRLEVTRFLINGTETLTNCDLTSSLVSGSLSCSVGGSKASYSVKSYRTLSGVEKLIDSLSFSVAQASKNFGLEGLMWSFLLLFSMILVGLFSPPIAMGLYLIGFIFLATVGLIHSSPAIIVAHIALAGLFWWAFKG